MARARIAVLGASGYTGADLVRLALTHPDLEIAALGANAKAGQEMADIWPHMAPYRGALPRLAKAEDIDFTGIDAVFGCLPHAASAEVLGAIQGPRIIDLSADFRLRDPATYQQWYGIAHPAPERLPDAVYGLTEFARAALPTAQLVACPGCYPTAALLALVPLARAGLIRSANITINALSGVSGAGRSLKESNLFPKSRKPSRPTASAATATCPKSSRNYRPPSARPSPSRSSRTCCR
jgi:N-acetyl-gamma-glutamyl-phosphate reductase